MGKRKIKKEALIYLIGGSITAALLLIFVVTFIIQQINLSKVNLVFANKETSVEVYSKPDLTTIIAECSGNIEYPEVNTNILGPQEVYFIVTNKDGTSKKFSHIINIVDTTPPIISLHSLTVVVDTNVVDFRKNINGDSMDNFDGLVHTTFTGEIKAIPGIYPITFSAKDTSGNVGSKIVYYLYNVTPETISAPFKINDIIIVNKKIPLPESYNPGRDAEADIMLRNMIMAAKNVGYVLFDNTAFVSYENQARIYQQQTANYSAFELDRFVAKPGYSEHQTGLAFDIIDGSTDFSKSPASKWLVENCAEYGFILRYPKDKEIITGCNYEPWHFRYVGVKIAKEIMEKNITLEQYLGVEN